MAQTNNTPYGSGLSRRSFLRLSAWTGAGVLLVGLGGCGSDGADGSSSGATDGVTLTMLNYSDWMGKNEISDFESKTGCTIDQLPTPDGGTNAMINALTQNEGSYDFALVGNNAAERLKENDLIADFDSSKVPNLKNVPDDIKKSYPYGIPVEQGKLGFIYSKKALPKPPKGFKELFDQISDDALSGKVLFPSYDSDVIDCGLKALGYDISGASTDQVNKARDLVIKAKPHIKAFIDSGAPQQVLDGSAALAIAYDYDYASAYTESDDLAWISPSEGCPGYLDGWLPLAGSQNLDAVYKFMNFHLEPDNYADFINVTHASWIMPSVKDKLDDEVAKCEALDPEKNKTDYVVTDSDQTSAEASAWQEIQNA